MPTQKAPGKILVLFLFAVFSLTDNRKRGNIVTKEGGELCLSVERTAVPSAQNGKAAVGVKRSMDILLEAPALRQSVSVGKEWKRSG